MTEIEPGGQPPGFFVSAWLSRCVMHDAANAGHGRSLPDRPSISKSQRRRVASATMPQPMSNVRDLALTYRHSLPIGLQPPISNTGD
ncbi:hypothetical protein [Mesorhizobium wenxiniae]|uniref:hypothetical protein n=1 Tax=Mesorhizobium wenxiniae TaxID=2014805 RepID=UPI0010544E36|nr:hypothetical protein [Mesorhizobium wenxiniae]